MAHTFSTWLPVMALLVLLYAHKAHAFGAGNIGSTSNIEGQNWRHGDIEDTLLTLLTARAMGGKKFSKLDVKRTYFGNWLRDYSQAVDVGTVKHVSAEAIRLLLWILGFMTFGYGTGEFEVTRDRLGCYRPEEHIDNPRDYADNQDARQYDRRLRGPIDERRELSIDERTGLKNYIASEDLGIQTSSAMVRQLLMRCVDLGRKFTYSNDKKEFYEALRLLGTACHCLEDYSAHSNYTELALIEMGERQVFPHVGRRVQVRLQGAHGPVYPIITGTFGGVDFLHSVMGEFTDKATQFELDELENTMQQAQNADTSLLKELLDKLPSGLFGGDDKKAKADELQANAQAARLENMHISPKDPEEFTQQMEQITKQIYPLFEFHDNIVMSISEAIDKIPILPDIIEQVQEQVSIFVFSLMAPIVMPIVNQVKSELKTGSSEVIQSSKNQQLNVFQDDNCSDPTHSMLSKDHFSNILNEPAGKIASAVLKWAVPQIVQCWDDDNVDPRRTIDRIVNGVFHHPALREHGADGASDGRRAMFETVERWWQEKDERERDDLRNKLSRDGVEQGRNHKEGVHDNGHGCGKPLGLPHAKQQGSGGAIGGVLGALSGQQGGRQSSQHTNQIGDAVGDAVGGGALGSVVGGLVGAVGAGVLGGVFGGKDDDDKEDDHRASGGYGQSTSYSQSSGGYGQTSSYNQSSGSSGGYGQHAAASASSHSYSQPSGGYEQQSAGYGSSSAYHQASSGYGQSSRTYGSGRDERESEYSGQSQRYGEESGRNTGYNHQQPEDDRPSYGQSYSGREESRTSYGQEQHTSERYDQSSGRYQQQSSYGRKKNDSDDSDDSNDDDDWEKKQRKQRKKEQKQHGFGGGRSRSRSGSRERRRSGSRKRNSTEYGRGNSQRDQYSQQTSSYSRPEQQYGQRDEYSQPVSGYGREEHRSEGHYGQQASDSGDRYDSQPAYGRSEQQSYGGDRYESQPAYGRSEQQYGGGSSRAEYGQSGRDEYAQTDYGQRQAYGDGRREEYGRRNDDENENENRYGEQMPGGYSGESSYGGGYGGNSYGEERREW